MSWDSTAVGDGRYTLRAVVTDGAGGSTTVTQAYRVANSRPPAPIAFAAAAVPGGIALTWQQPAFEEAALYQLYRDGSQQPMAELPSDHRAYVDTIAISEAESSIGSSQHSYSPDPTAGSVCPMALQLKPDRLRSGCRAFRLITSPFNGSSPPACLWTSVT